MHELYSKALAFILWNFEDMCQGSNFYKISANSMKKIIQSPYLRLKRSNLLLEPLEKWNSINSNEAKITTENIQAVRSLPVYPCCIGRYKKSPFVFLYDPEDRKVVPYLSLVDKVTSKGVTANGFQVGSTGVCLYTFGGEFSFGRGDWNNTVWKYNTITEHWIQVMTLDVPRRHHSMAFNENSFFVIGKPL